jgi:hypothetical protein
MQTFLPYPDFSESVRCLDWRRLGKQRVEAWQILNVLNSPAGAKTAWINHPAVLMWKGYSTALAVYCEHACIEWSRRGYRDTIRNRLWQLSGICITPPWLGGAEFHAAHRSILLAKQPNWYSRFGWPEQPAMRNEKGSFPYVWPVRKEAI